MREKKFLTNARVALVIIVIASIMGCNKEDGIIPEPREIVLSKSGPGVSDIDGNQYPTVIIGDLEWMATNLRTTRYKDGKEILKSGEGIANQGDYSVYPHLLVADIGTEAEMISFYGMHYSGYAVKNSAGLCPAEWRIPSISDWDYMENFLVTNHKLISFENVGDALKSCRTFSANPENNCQVQSQPYWTERANTDMRVANLSGFNALPAGVRDAYITHSSRWWTSTYEEHVGVSVYLHFAGGEIQRGINSMMGGFSVRCVKDVK
jgi:uncharacterized protein (TIGR02145 family)